MSAISIYSSYKPPALPLVEYVKIRGRDGTERAGEDDGGTRWKEKATCELGVFYHIGLV
jgi:hypothetical protein